MLCIACGYIIEFLQTRTWLQTGRSYLRHIFLLCAEIFAIKIKNNTNIKEIEINNNSYVILQYTDDTVIILDGIENSSRASVKEPEKFYTMSGLKINKSITQRVWIGEKKYCVIISILVLLRPSLLYSHIPRAYSTYDFVKNLLKLVLCGKCCCFT